MGLPEEERLPGILEDSLWDTGTDSKLAGASGTQDICHGLPGVKKDLGVQLSSYEVEKQGRVLHKTGVQGVYFFQVGKECGICQLILRTVRQKKT